MVKKSFQIKHLKPKGNENKSSQSSVPFSLIEWAPEMERSLLATDAIMLKKTGPCLGSSQTREADRQAGMHCKEMGPMFWWDKIHVCALKRALWMLGGLRMASWEQTHLMGITAQSSKMLGTLRNCRHGEQQKSTAQVDAGKAHRKGLLYQVRKLRIYL